MTDGPADSADERLHLSDRLAMSRAPRGLEEERVFSRVARAMLGEDAPLPRLGRFELQSRIGSGAMGEVYAASDPDREQDVALKVLAMHREADPASIHRLKREARALARLQHPHIVAIYEVGEDDGRIYIAMERLRGEGLDERLSSGALSSAQTSRIIQDVCAAMECAHAENIVHRDLKPANIYLVGPEPRAKVLDFGVAKGLSTATLGGTTVTGTVLGTPYYMSPEQARDASKVDARADLWAVAIIAYECVVGSRPFDATNLPDLAVQLLTKSTPTPSEHGPVPRGFDAWFARATHGDPDKRFATAQQLAAALSEVLLDAPESNHRMRWGLWVAAAAAAAALGIWLAAAPASEPVRPAPPAPTAAQTPSPAIADAPQDEAPDAAIGPSVANTGPSVAELQPTASAPPDSPTPATDNKPVPTRAMPVDKPATAEHDVTDLEL